MTNYAHSIDGKGEDEWEDLPTHLQNVGRCAADLAASFGGESFAYASGTLHDIGKVDPVVQERIRGKNVRVDHSTAGAALAIEKYGSVVGKMLAFGIAGHHAGLANGIRIGGRTRPLKERLDSFTLPAIPPGTDLSPPVREMKAPGPMTAPGFTWEFSAPFLTRMVFSCLVDADFLETEKFYRGDVGRGRYPSLETILSRLTDHMQKLSAEADKTPVNGLRSEVLDAAIQRSSDPPGLFTMTVPTGGSKTLSSAVFALRHAIAHGKRRVIIVIPYTSIIEQTADVLRKALGSDAVLEHHSAFDEELLSNRSNAERGKHDDSRWSGTRKLRLATENWDAPVIVTTAVQFFESLFANRPGKCRKLHSIAQSVVIVDEAQTMPLPLLRPCLEALRELARGYGTSVVFCTATQPAIRAEDGFQSGMEGVREIAPDPASLYQRLKRVEVKRLDTPLTEDELADQIRGAHQVLVVVNNRKQARALYHKVSDCPGARHLTTWMCAAHRRDVLAGIRADLHPDQGKPVRLISTSLIEAGVDVDFPLVYRELAGLDSINQTAGRCNREGKMNGLGTTFVFEFKDSPHKPPPDLVRYASVTDSVLRTHAGDPISLEAIKAYFTSLYWRRGDKELDSAMVGEAPGQVKGILTALAQHKSDGDYPFTDVAAAFRLISSHTVPLIVPYGAALNLVGELRKADRPGWIARKLQSYTVQIKEEERDELVSTGRAEVIRPDDFGQQFVLLADINDYQEDVGFVQVAD